MKQLDWVPVVAATPCRVTCNHCQRPKIVVNKQTGLRAKHRVKPKTQPGRNPHPWCDGGERHYESTPADTT